MVGKSNISFWLGFKRNIIYFTFGCITVVGCLTVIQLTNVNTTNIQRLVYVFSQLGIATSAALVDDTSTDMKHETGGFHMEYQTTSETVKVEMNDTADTTNVR